MQHRFTLTDSCLTVPSGAGLGVTVRDDVLIDLGARRDTVTAGRQ